jgi:endonuclease VIII
MAAVPEGHTIHRHARQQLAVLDHHSVAASSPQGRFSDAAALVDGTVLDGIDAWGKHLFYRFAEDRVIHVHLGLFGKYFPFSTASSTGAGRSTGPADDPGDPDAKALERPAPAVVRQVRLRLANATGGFDLTGPTTCELITAADVKAVTDRLGPDPLRRGADPDRAWAKLSRRATPVGVAIMDQSVVAGVGNVFRAESLYVHGIHPERPGKTLTRDEWDALWATLVQMLRAGVRTGVIATVPRRDPSVHDGRTRYVYKQDHCARCGSPIRRWDLSGRWAYACEVCQPPWAA